MHMIRAFLMQTILILLAVYVLVGCKVDAPKSPPPAAEGKCLVDFYIGDRAKNQTCIYQGYTWSCENDGNHFDAFKREAK